MIKEFIKLILPQGITERSVITFVLGFAAGGVVAANFTSGSGVSVWVTVIAGIIGGFCGAVFLLVAAPQDDLNGQSKNHQSKVNRDEERK